MNAPLSPNVTGATTAGVAGAGVEGAGVAEPGVAEADGPLDVGASEATCP